MFDISIRYYVKEFCLERFFIKYVYLDTDNSVSIIHESSYLLALRRNNSKMCYRSHMEGYTPVTSSFRSHRDIYVMFTHHRHIDGHYD